MRIGYQTDPGRCKTTNEDSLYINENAGLFIVADGMGGHNAGEIASKIAITVIGALIEEELESAKDATELVRIAIQKANETIFKKSQKRTAWSEMGTTVLVALLKDGNWILGHVGDSRAYTIRNGNIRQITEDHTFVAEWLKEGLITAQEARTHAQRHGLTETLGVTDEVEIDIDVQLWDDAGCLLLCSDGLTDMVEDEEIQAIVQSSSGPAEACRGLVDAANDGGGRDNITVILICPH